MPTRVTVLDQPSARLPELIPVPASQVSRVPSWYSERLWYYPVSFVDSPHCSDTHVLWMGTGH